MGQRYKIPLSRRFVIFIVGSWLSACSFGYNIKTTENNNGDIWILSDGDKSGIFPWDKPPLCIAFVRVTQGGDIIWQVENQYIASVERCVTTFPLRYGDNPPGFDVVVKPKKLKQGIKYSIEASGFGGRGDGTFIYR